MEPQTLPKSQRLCSTKAIELLFSKGHSAIDFPLRAVFRFHPREAAEPVARFMITVPKKKMRHAVERVLLRRRIREAYRLNRDILFSALEGKDCQCDIAFVYLSNHKADYATIEACVKQLLGKMAESSVS